MASPFSVFRKNQKLMLALLTLLAMFGFVLLPPLMDLLGGHAQINPIVAKSKFGNLRASDAEGLMRQRRGVLNVLSTVLQSIGAAPEMATRFLESRFGPTTEESVVHSWLLARHAQQSGMVVSNDAINAFLKALTGERAKSDAYQAAFQHSGISERQFFEAMRDELAAMQLQQSFNISLGAATPGQRWEWFTRVKRKATIEAIPVAATDYVKKIADPTDDDLKKFFEDNKDRYAVPSSPEPGFHRPHKVALEYFKIDKTDFEAIAAAVTDAEILQRYEKNRAGYDQMFEEQSAEPAGGLQKDIQNGGVQKLNETPKAPTTAKPVGAVQPTNKPANVKKDVKPAEVKKEKKPAAQEKKPPVQGDVPKKRTSSVGAASPFMLASILQVKDETKAENGGKKAASPRPAAKPSDPEKKTAADKAVAPVQAAGTKEPVNKKTADKKPAAVKNEVGNKKPAAEKAATPKAGLSDRQKTYLRNKIAIEKVLAVFEKLYEPMDQYREVQTDYESREIENKGKAEKDKEILGPKPSEPNFKALAKQYHFSIVRTPLLSAWELQAQGPEIVASHRVMFVPDDRGERQLRLGESIGKHAYQSLAKYRPETALDALGNWYLVWKIDDTKEYVPNFTDPGVREEALLALKMIRASDLAMKAAESLAEEARKSQKSLRDVCVAHPNRRVVLPPAFSWMTGGSVADASRTATISEVAGINAAGTEFMRAVFRLGPGQVGAALNAPKTIAYVVRLEDYTPVYKVLWDQFVVDDFSQYASAGAEDRQEVRRAWLNDIKASAGFEWTPDHKPGRVTESGPSGPSEDD